MPYNSRYAGGPEDFYQQGGDFDPYTGRLQGGNMVLEFLARLAGQKEQKKKEQWDMEDRSSELEMRKLQQTAAEQGVAMNQRKIQDYQPPIDPLVEMLEGRNVKAKDQMNRIELEKERGVQDRLTVAARGTVADKAVKSNTMALRKQYLSAKDRIEASFSRELASIEKQHTEKVAAIRKDKNLTSIEPSVGPNPYLIALKGSLAARDRMKKEAAARKAQELEQLEQAYSTGQVVAAQSAKDEYGYSIGEEQDFPEGRFKYIGKNQWQQVR